MEMLADKVVARGRSGMGNAWLDLNPMKGGRMVKELMDLIGKKTQFRLGGLFVDCLITNARMNYGRVEVEITPVSGIGRVWKAMTPAEEALLRRLEMVKKTQRRHTCAGCGSLIKTGSKCLALVEEGANEYCEKTITYFCDFYCYNELECKLVSLGYETADLYQEAGR